MSIIMLVTVCNTGGIGKTGVNGRILVLYKHLVLVGVNITYLGLGNEQCSEWLVAWYWGVLITSLWAHVLGPAPLSDNVV